MGISIITKFLGPTNSRGARVVAQVSDYGSSGQKAAAADGKPGRKVMHWEDGANVEDNHKLAAFDLALALGWSGEWIGGEAPGGAGYVFVRKGGCNFTVPAAE